MAFTIQANSCFLPSYFL